MKVFKLNVYINIYFEILLQRLKRATDKNSKDVNRTHQAWIFLEVLRFYITSIKIISSKFFKQIDVSTVEMFNGFMDGYEC